MPHLVVGGSHIGSRKEMQGRLRIFTKGVVLLQCTFIGEAKKKTSLFSLSNKNILKEYL